VYRRCFITMHVFQLASSVIESSTDSEGIHVLLNMSWLILRWIFGFSATISQRSTSETTQLSYRPSTITVERKQNRFLLSRYCNFVETSSRLYLKVRKQPWEIKASVISVPVQLQDVGTCRVQGQDMLMLVGIRTGSRYISPCGVGRRGTRSGRWVDHWGGWSDQTMVFLWALPKRNVGSAVDPWWRDAIAGIRPDMTAPSPELTGYQEAVCITYIRINGNTFNYADWEKLLLKSSAVF
jgi:hypothetical protein